MSKGFKIILIVFIIVAILCGIIYFTIDDHTSTNNQTQTKEKLKSEIPKGIIIDNENIIVEDGVLYLDFTVVNKSKKNIKIKKINAIIIDEENNIISDLIINVDEKLKSNEKVQLSASDETSYKGENTKIIYKVKKK